MLKKLIEFFERETGVTIEEAYNLSPEEQEAIWLFGKDMIFVRKLQWTYSKKNKKVIVFFVIEIIWICFPSNADKAMFPFSNWHNELLKLS